MGAAQPAHTLRGPHARAAYGPDGPGPVRAATEDRAPDPGRVERQGGPARPTRTNPDGSTISHRLTQFYQACADAGLPEFERLATTINTWWPEILAFIHSRVTNAGSEGTNRVIKTIARDAYGFRNPVNQRLRTRCATTRRTRGHLNPR